MKYLLLVDVLFPSKNYLLRFALFWTFRCLGKRVESGISIRVCALFQKTEKFYHYQQRQGQRE